MLSKSFDVLLDANHPFQDRKKLKDEQNLDVKYVQLDVTSEESVKQARDVVEKEEGRIDALVNNAGELD